MNPSLTLDDLLKANQEQFDKIFAVQQQALGSLDLRQRPPPAAPATPTPLPPNTEQAPPRPAARTPPSVPQTAGVVDALTLDLIDHALRRACQEMHTVSTRSASSLLIREQHAAAPLLADAQGRMIAGHCAASVAALLRACRLELDPGDVILQSDPYAGGGALGQANDWLVLVPVFAGAERIGFSAMTGRLLDVGGIAPAGMATTATSIFAEGLCIPPVKLYAGGVLNQAALDLILRNTRTPERNHTDLLALVAGCRVGERYVIDLCARFGVALYREACAALLERTRRAVHDIIVAHLPEEPQWFEDSVDSDGRGNGPFPLKLTLWREGEHGYFDWTGTAPQAPGPINCYLHEDLAKLCIGAYLIMAFAPETPFNAGFYDLIHVTLPPASLLQPRFPAALGGGSAVLTRQFDVLGGALAKTASAFTSAAGYGASPHFLYTGVDRHGRPFQLLEILHGGLPGRAIGDGLDGHSWWPLLENIPTETLERDYPIIVERQGVIADSGGAGRHRGGNGIEKVYCLLAPGEVSIHDDRERSRPWGIRGGKPGARSEKWLLRVDGSRVALASKVEQVTVQNGDRIIFRSASGGGWGDPLERDPRRVRNDVARKLVSLAAARADYGVVLGGSPLKVDGAATGELREDLKRKRKALPLFDFGERVAD
ncbi:MAG: hydantoinase B/oxoprolinase family protein [Gammaproteobacteria bacterium]